DVLCNDVVPSDHHDIELAAVAAKKVCDRACVGVEVDLDARLLKHGHVRLAIFQIVRDEGYLAAELQEKLQQLLRTLRAGILIGRQHACVNRQNATFRPTVALELRRDSVCPMSPQYVGPFGMKRTLIDDLVTLDAARQIRPGRCALEMHYGSKRLIVDLAPGRAHREGKIAVFAIRGCEPHIEAADLVEQHTIDGKTSPGAVIDLAKVVELRPIGILAATDIPRRTVSPDDASGLLQPTIGAD